MLSSAYVWAKVLGQLESKIPSISSWFESARNAANTSINGVGK